MSTTTRNVMKAGFYNYNSQMQSNGAKLSLPLLVKAAKNLPLKGESSSFSIQIADLGCSQGLNSMEYLKLVLSTLQQVLQRNTDVRVTHEDLPTNDFSSLLEVLHNPHLTYMPHPDAASEILPRLNVYPSFIGKSFYERLFPESSVHLAFAFSCLHWLRTKPTKPEHGVFPHITDDARVKEAFLREFQEGLHQFLQLRAAEAIPDSSLVIHFPINANPEPKAVWLISDIINTMVAEGKLVKSDIGEMCPGCFLATAQDVKDVLSLAADEWKVESCADAEILHPAQADFDTGKITAEEYAEVVTRLWVAILEPSFLAGLEVGHGKAHAADLVRELFDRCRNRLAEEPSPMYMKFVYAHLVRRAI